MSHSKTISKCRWLTLLGISLGLFLAFQNCARSSDHTNAVTPPPLTSSEINSTKATAIRIDSQVVASSGETFEIVAYAEDSNGTVINDFNYSAQLVLKNPYYLLGSSYQLCAGPMRFENGILKANISILNNTTADLNSVSFEISSVGLPNSVTGLLLIKAPIDPDFSEVSIQSQIPPPRSKATAIYDPVKKRVLLFGGREIIEYVGNVQDGNALNDLWELDVSAPNNPTWHNITPQLSPSPRFGYTLVLDSNRKRLLLFGGADQNGVVANTLWAFDLQSDTWSELNPLNSAPVARFDHSAAYDSTTSNMIILGGSTGPGSTMFQPFTFRSGASPDGNWIANGTLPTNPSKDIPIIYWGDSAKILNPFYSELALKIPEYICNGNGNVPYGCVMPKKMLALDTDNKMLWMISPVAVPSAPVLPQQTVQQYKPLMKVLKKQLPIKPSCN